MSDGESGRGRARRRVLSFADGQLARQLDFIIEVDRLKTVLRRTTLTDRSRRENSAEHSWHLALMAVLLADYSPVPVDVSRVVEMVLVHDLVEIDAGDTFCYDADALVDKAEREQRAAERIFGLLPREQGERLRALWEEFEARESAEARFANALDRLQPMIHNYLTEGHSWQEHGIVRTQVLARNAPVEDGAPELWQVARRFIDDAVSEGWLEREEPSTVGSER